MRHLLFVLFLMTLGPVGQQVDPSAARAIDQLVQGARIYEMPEGKKLVEENSWNDLDLPIFTNAETIFESSFDTDAAGVKGVKRLVELAGAGESGGLLTRDLKKLRDIQEKYGERQEPLTQVRQRFLVIAYQDTSTKAWKVISVTHNTDTAAEVEKWRDFGKPDKYSLVGLQPSWKRYLFARALIDDGKLNGARRELEGCSQMSRAEKAAQADKKASPQLITASIEEIDEILGTAK